MKNKFFGYAAALFVLFVFAPQIFAEPYGSFTLENGEARILHAGAVTVVKTSNPIVVFENDTVQLSQDSNGILKDNKNAVIKIGSNAVVKVKAWKTSSSSGFLSLVYGKIKASISGLRVDESFNVKTANSIIGVKGTEYSGAVSEGGDTLGWAMENNIFITDTKTQRQAIVPQGYYVSNDQEGGMQAMVKVNEDYAKMPIAELLASNGPGKGENKNSLDNFFATQPNVGKVEDRQQADQKEQIKKAEEGIRSAAGEPSLNTIKINFIDAENCSCTQ